MPVDIIVAATTTCDQSYCARVGGASGGSSSGGSSSSSSSSGAAGGCGPAAATPDTIAPVIAEHANLRIDAAGAAGAAVSYRVVATDADTVEVAVTVSCAPAPGSTFRLGRRGRTRTTTGTCHAHDPAGNSAAPRLFTVTVLGAGDQIPALERHVRAGKRLTRTQKRLLVSTLARANRSLAADTRAAAMSRLRTFVSDVRKRRRTLGRESTVWIAAANRTIRVVRQAPRIT